MGREARTMVCGATCLVFPQHAANPWAAASSILWCSASSSRKTQRRSVIDLPAIAAPVDRNHGAKDNERSLSGSIDKGPLAACRSRSPAKAKTRKSDRPDWRKSSHGRAGHADAPGRASRWRLPHGTAERAGKSSRAGAWVAHPSWGRGPGCLSRVRRNANRLRNKRQPAISPASWKIIALDMDDLVFVERDLQQFIDGLAVAEAI